MVISSAIICASLAVLLMTTTAVGRSWHHSLSISLGSIDEGTVGRAGPVAVEGSATKATFLVLSVSDFGDPDDVAQGFTTGLQDANYEISWPLTGQEEKASLPLSASTAAYAAYRHLGHSPDASLGTAIFASERTSAGDFYLLFGGLVAEVDGVRMSDVWGSRESVVDTLTSAGSRYGLSHLEVQSFDGTVSMVKADRERYLKRIGYLQHSALLESVPTTHVREGSGPSAGLAFALAYADAFAGGSKNDLTVAATGTVSPDGAVSSVSSIRAKVSAAAANGADVVFLPVDPPTDGDVVAPEEFPGIDVRYVNSLSEAAGWLCDRYEMEHFCW